MDRIYLNGFPKIIEHLNLLEYETFVFSGGEVHIKIKGEPSCKYITIFARANNSEDFIRIVMCHDALKRMGYEKINLFMPYVPYARQDKVMVNGEAFSLKVFSHLINSCGFNKINTFDVHSDVGSALLDDCENISNHTFISECLNEIEVNPLLVSVDSGAYKKVFKLADYLGYKEEIILCNKARDLNSGKILSYTVDKNDLGGRDLLLVDDICDGGGTFLLMADELKKRNCGKLYLAVSHGIFSKGIEIISSKFDKIFTTQSIKDIQNESVKQIPFQKFIDFSKL